MFEREQLRAKLLEGRVEEIKLRRRSVAEVQSQEHILPAAPSTNTDLNPDNPDEYMQIINTDLQFRDTLNSFNETVIQVIKKRQEQKFRMEQTVFEMDATDEQLLQDSNLIK